MARNDMFSWLEHKKQHDEIVEEAPAALPHTDPDDQASATSFEQSQQSVETPLVPKSDAHDAPAEDPPSVIPQDTPQDSPVQSPSPAPDPDPVGETATAVEAPAPAPQNDDRPDTSHGNVEAPHAHNDMNGAHIAETLAEGPPPLPVQEPATPEPPPLPPQAPQKTVIDAHEPRDEVYAEEDVPETAPVEHVVDDPTQPDPVDDEHAQREDEQRRAIEELAKVRHEPRPVAGMHAVELAPPRVRRAYVVAVKAGRNRVMARLRDTNQIRGYTLRADGTYRLEGAPTGTAPRLVLGVDY